MLIIVTALFDTFLHLAYANHCNNINNEDNFDNKDDDNNIVSLFPVDASYCDDIINNNMEDSQISMEYAYHHINKSSRDKISKT